MSAVVVSKQNEERNVALTDRKESDDDCGQVSLYSISLTFTPGNRSKHKSCQANMGLAMFIAGGFSGNRSLEHRSRRRCWGNDLRSLNDNQQAESVR